jgi:hypothetical protein
MKPGRERHTAARQQGPGTRAWAARFCVVPDGVQRHGRASRAALRGAMSGWVQVRLVGLWAGQSFGSADRCHALTVSPLHEDQGATRGSPLPTLDVHRQPNMLRTASPALVPRGPDAHLPT